MANRRIEMYEYRQVLHRMRCGDSNREIARSRLMGRRKARQVRRMAQQEGWLDPAVSLPDAATLAEHFRRDKPSRSAVSRVEPHRKEVTQWFQEGIDGTGPRPSGSPWALGFTPPHPGARPSSSGIVPPTR